ncbi:MAG: phosphomannomutase/phosphoglucomutase [Nitrospinae bacterium]|nr:phosphomannomutase/phosphoglucomutase [Nitrospinota bacterium]
MNPLIFREYDIRGTVGKDLTHDVVRDIGRGYGTMMRNLGKRHVTVGRDNRLSSKDFRDAIVEGILSTGIDVTDCGLIPTPLLYFSLFHLPVDGAVQITGSHNPPEFNGFKLCVGKTTIHGKEIQHIREIIESGKLSTGKGNLKEYEIITPYLEMVKSKIKLDKKLKVVLDGGNGTSGLIAPKLLRDLGCEVSELYCNLDGNFPNHFPDPTVVKNLTDLIKKVRDEKADVGIGYDGDADRIGVVDNEGNIIWGDQLMIIFARDILKRKPGAKIVFEVKCSQNLGNDIKKHGGIPIMWAAGHSLIKDKMLKENAEFGGEMSGHIFFKDGYFGFDDAIFASLRLLLILSGTNRKITDMLSDVPKTVSTPEIRVDCPDEEKFEIVKKITAGFKKEYEVIAIDGARVIFDSGWGLIRASNTQPVLVVRFEADTKEKLEDYKNIIYKKLKEFPALKDLKRF